MNIKIRHVMIAAPLFLQTTLGMAALKLGDFDLSGNADLGVQLSNGAETKSSKFRPYEDVRKSVLAGASVGTEKDGYHLDFDASRIALKDQSYSLSGGKYGMFKYNVFFDSIYHKSSVNNTTLFSGVGTGVLTYDAAVVDTTNADSWTTKFDYTTTKKKYGVEASYFSDAPYSLDLGFNQVKDSGIKVIGVNGGIASTQGVEIPEPVDYTTNNFNAGVGYRGNDWAVNVDGSMSNFSNANQWMTFRNPYATAVDSPETISNAPNNAYKKIGLQANYKNLPLESMLVGKVNYSKLTNSCALPATWTHTKATTAGTATPYGDSRYGGASVTDTLNASADTFVGDVSYAAAGLALTSNPVADLDTKLYANYLRKYNKSTEVTYPSGTRTKPTAGTYTGYLNELYTYNKSIAGAEAGYRLSFATRVGAGYEFLRIHRERDDGVRNIDNTWFVQARNSYFDFIDFNVRYQKLGRSAEWEAKTVGTNYYRATDVTAKKQERASAGFDLTPIEHLEVGFETTYQSSIYNPDGIMYGRQKDRTIGYFADVTYDLPRWFKVNTFLGRTRATNSVLRRLSKQAGSAVLTGMNAPADAADDQVNGHLITYDETALTYDYGVGFEVPVIEKKLSVGFGWQQAKNKGNIALNTASTQGVSYTTSTGAVVYVPRENIENWDNYLETAFRISTKYEITSNLSASLGYTYQWRTYNDTFFDGYYNVNQSQAKTVPAASSASIPDLLVTGVGNDNNFKAHTAVITASYSF